MIDYNLRSLRQNNHVPAMPQRDANHFDDMLLKSLQRQQRIGMGILVVLTTAVTVFLCQRFLLGS